MRLMIIRYVILCGFLLSAAYAQKSTAGRFLAMGDAGVAVRDIHSITVNPAGLSEMKNIAVGMLYRNHFLDADIHSQAIYVGVPSVIGVFGVVADRYALYEAFSNTSVGGTYCRMFGHKLAAALAVHYHQLRIPQYGHRNAFSVDFGLQYQVTTTLNLGVHYANLGNMQYDRDVFAVIPSVFRFGASYGFGKTVLLATDVLYYAGAEKLWDQRIGLEYQIVPVLAFRGGVSINPVRQYAGVGIRWSKFDMDFTSVFHSRLGMSPQIGLSYAF